MSAWTPEDQKLAEDEGWYLTPFGHINTVRFALFPSNPAARAHVVAEAAAGSALHSKALGLEKNPHVDKNDKGRARRDHTAPRRQGSGRSDRSGKATPRSR